MNVIFEARMALRDELRIVKMKIEDLRRAFTSLHDYRYVALFSEQSRLERAISEKAHEQRATAKKLYEQREVAEVVTTGLGIRVAALRDRYKATIKDPKCPPGSKHVLTDVIKHLDSILNTQQNEANTCPTLPPIRPS